MSIENLKLVDAKDVRTSRSSGGLKSKDKTYTKYEVALKKVIPLLRREFEENEIIRVKTKDILRAMGGDFVMRQPTALLLGIRYVMFKEGIFLNMGMHKNGDDIYIMRKVVIGDKLPDTIQ